MSWQKLYRRPLLDLGKTGNSDFSGIYSPGYDAATVGQYVQAQFMEEAETYAAKYAATDYWRMLIEKSFGAAGITPGETTILDLGSGAGNTIFPLLDLCPQALVVASDISVRMLALLKRALQAKHNLDRVVLMELNAEDLDFFPQTFDLVIGGAVLHHLLNPAKTIEACARILKPGGYAIFFEPFENGNAILARIYHAIVAGSGDDVPADVRQFFTHFVQDLGLRKGRDKSHPIFRQLDDKWCFTRKYFEELSELLGFSKCIIYPLHQTKQQFERQTEVYLRLGLGRGREGLPEWAWKMVRQFDSSFSEDLKADMLIEGCIMFRK